MVTKKQEKHVVGAPTTTLYNVAKWNKNAYSAMSNL